MGRDEEKPGTKNSRVALGRCPHIQGQGGLGSFRPSLSHAWVSTILTPTDAVLLPVLPPSPVLSLLHYLLLPGQ